MANVSGRRWGQKGEGATVTWSLAGPGVEDLGVYFGGDDVTRDPFNETDLNVLAIIRRAMDSWESVANVDFVRTVDDGNDVGERSSTNIRIYFGAVGGGEADYLAQAYLPASRKYGYGGDIAIDTLEDRLMRDPKMLQGVIAHELGHALGLGHEDKANALMNPSYHGVIGPLADDRNGIRKIYGAPDDDSAPFFLRGGTPDLTVLDGFDGLKIIGDQRANNITGGRHAELLSGMGRKDVLMGRRGADTLLGGAHGDDLFGGKGDDRLFGGDGRDTITSGGGQDRINGDRGVDLIYGGQGGDWISGGAGADSLIGDAGDDTLVGGAQQDTLRGGAGDDILRGEGGEDRFQFSQGHGRDTIKGFENGRDILDYSLHQGVNDFADLHVESARTGVSVSDGEGGVVIIRGVDVSDFDESDVTFTLTRPLPDPDLRIAGGRAADYLYGLNGDDSLYGRRGPDNLYGAFGEDLLVGGQGADELFGGSGADHLRGGIGDDILWGDAGDDKIFGGTGDDTLWGERGDEAGDDTLHGGAGDDWILSNVGADLIFGGRGNDRLGGGVLIFGGDGRDTLGGATDRLYGGAGDDQIHPGHEVIAFPGPGNDLIYARHADAIIVFAPEVAPQRDTMIISLHSQLKIDLTAYDLENGVDDLTITISEDRYTFHVKVREDFIDISPGRIYPEDEAMLVDHFLF